jgi:hypothetical protein
MERIITFENNCPVMNTKYIIDELKRNKIVFKDLLQDLICMMKNRKTLSQPSLPEGTHRNKE